MFPSFLCRTRRRVAAQPIRHHYCNSGARRTHTSVALYNSEWRTFTERSPLRKNQELNLVAIAGPTGCGKSELALRIAAEFGGEVVNCDSVQIYRFFNIGTAKLPLESRRGIPHHMIDIANPD